MQDRLFLLDSLDGRCCLRRHRARFCVSVFLSDLFLFTSLDFILACLEFFSRWKFKSFSCCVCVRVRACVLQQNAVLIDVCWFRSRLYAPSALTLRGCYDKITYIPVCMKKWARAWENVRIVYRHHVVWFGSVLLDFSFTLSLLTVCKYV